MLMFLTELVWDGAHIRYHILYLMKNKIVRLNINNLFEYSKVKIVNVIYNVIWSKARGCLVVASEKSLNTGKSSGSKTGPRGIIACVALIAAGAGGHSIAGEMLLCDGDSWATQSVSNRQNGSGFAVNNWAFDGWCAGENTGVAMSASAKNVGAPGIAALEGNSGQYAAFQLGSINGMGVRGGAYIDAPAGLNLTSRTALNSNGTINANNGINVTKGINMRSSKITELVAGSEATDAVNFGQLSTVQSTANAANSTATAANATASTANSTATAVSTSVSGL
ncbi:ESPR domain-containing protein, partial [Comamonas sp. C24C]